MKIFLSCALLLVGAVLIHLGLAAAEPIGSGLFSLFTCSAADRTIWALVGGMVASGAGAGGLLHESLPVRLPPHP